jgi:hypothetical protein
LHPGADQLADRCSRILLNEMPSGDRRFSLIFPASTILTESSGKKGARIRIDEQFRDLIFRHPACIRVNDRIDVRRFTSDWNLSRPCEGRPTIFPAEERLAVLRHLDSDRLLITRLGKHGRRLSAFGATPGAPRFRRGAQLQGQRPASRQHLQRFLAARKPRRVLKALTADTSFDVSRSRSCTL